MPRTDATTPGTPDKQQIIDALTAAAKPASDGTLYIRACVACKIIGVGPGSQSMWERRGKIAPTRFRVPPRQGASMGVVVAWPLDQVIWYVKQRIPASERVWSERDDNYLLESLGKLSLDAIARELGRTINAVQCRGYDLGVNMHTNAGKLTTGDIAGLCRRTRQAVQLWCSRGDLRYTRLPMGRGDKLIDPADLIAFLKRNPKIYNGLPDASRRRLERMTTEVATPVKKAKAEPHPGPRVYRRCA
jgi:hypothetical protein